MVASSFFDVSTHEQNHNRAEALSSVKRRRVSASDNYDCLSSLVPAMSGACSPSSGLSSCSDLETGNESIFCLEMACQANGNAETAPHTTGAGGVPPSDKNCGGYGLSAFVYGWMYINEQGQMCGPYVQEQLFEGLSSGFLPDDLPVYPVVNGAFMSPVPLKFFKQYPDHVATGFVYLGGVTSNVSATSNCPVGPVLDACQSSAPVSVNDSQQAFVQHDTSISNAVASDPVATSTSTVVQQVPLAWEERCWLFLDEYRRNNGPHSLSELYYWHQYGYLHNSVMIHHTENKSNLFTLQSLIDAWRKNNSCSAAFSNIIGNEPSGSFDFISGISGEIGSQLHGGIMKAARRFFLDEIVGNVIVDFVATKKAQKQQKNEHPTEKVNVGERRDSASCTASGTCFVTSGSTNSANKYFQDLSMDLKMKSAGGFENLRTANIAISGVLFSYCMEVLWNAVFYDPVANYTLTWRNSRRRSQSNIGNEATEREPVLPVEEFDFPPGFQPRVEESLVCGSFSMSQSNFSEDKSSKPGSMVRSPMLKVEYAEIIEAVEKKLFLAAKESSDVFLIAALEEEVYALVKDLKDDGSKEVAIVSSKQVCNETDPATSGERTGCEMVQGLDSDGNGVDVSQTPMEGTESSNQADVSFHKHSLCDFLENGFKRLGTPATTVIDDQTIDEPDPPGLYCLKKIMPIQYLQMCLVGRSETPNQGLGSSHQTAASMYGNVSDFLGSAFKRLGTPTCGGLNVQRTDEPPPPGYENHIDKVVRSSYRKIRQLGPSEGIPKWRKFVLLALFRQKLHDDVLSEWKSSFDDDVRFKFLVSWCILKQCKAGQVKLASESGGFLELSSVMEPELDDLLERSKSCHSSGPSEVSVDMFTYSRKKKARKSSGDDPESPTLVDMILRRQSFKNFGKQKSSRDESGSGASGVVNVKHKINGSSWKPIESAVGTSKVGGTAKEKLNKDRLTIRTLATKKSPRMSGSSQDKVLVSSVKPGMSMVLGREVISKDTEELSSTKICDVVSEDKFAADESQKFPKSSKKMKLKREHVMDDSLPLLSKVPRLIDSYVKKTAGKKVAKSRILTSKLRLLSSCPISDGCARSSINGWEWRNWSLTARPAERARVRGIQITTVQRFSAEIIVSQSSHVKGISARTNRVKMRNLLAAAEGAELLKASQLNARKKRLRFQQSKIHDWGLVALEPIEADDFVIEYVGELIRPRISDIRELQYEKMGIGSSYLFRLDDGYVVDATKRGGVARFINHSCEPNCYTKIVSVEGQKRIFIYAKRHVAAGEEITYNYKFPLEEKKIPCNCGSKRCRGSMN